MQRSSVEEPSILSHQAASGGFVPPSWSELAPLLQGSAILWGSLLLIALLRAAIHKYFQSDTFRSIVKERKRSGRRPGPLISVERSLHALKQMLIRNRFPESSTAFWFGLPRFIAGVIICVLYIIDTYMKGIPPHFYAFQCIYGTAISLRLLMSFVYSERPVVFIFSLKALVECLSIPSLLFSSGARWLNFNFLQAYCILIEWALLEKHDIVMRNNSTLARLLINLFLQLLTFLYVTSCGVQFFELLGDPVQALRSETFQITWANSVYFAVVTLMTVGYGDFVPYTLFGRMWIVLHIIFVAYLVSREISLLIDALKSMRRGGGSYVNSSGGDHVVVTGRVKWEFLQQFVKEFLAEPSNLDTKVIVLTSNPTWSDDDWQKFVSHNPFFDHHLMFLEGSALKMDDLSRANVGAARAVFVLADPHRQDPYKEDSDILKSVLTIRNFSGVVPIYALNTLRDSSFQFGIAMEFTQSPTTYHNIQQRKLPLSNSFFGYPGTPGGPPTNALPASNSFGWHGEGPPSFSDRAPRAHSSQELNRVDSLGPLGTDGLYSLEENATLQAKADGIAASALSARTRRLRQRALLRKSESLCMQELETVLLAENTFCNGLSTLIANATLRVAPQSQRNDRPWLVEYKLGTECSIQQFVIRKEMSGLPFRKIAGVLQDYGLVLLAVRRKTEQNWNLITPDTVLEATMSSMALSYHDNTVIDRIADIAALFIRENNIAHQETDEAEEIDHRSDAIGPFHRLESRGAPSGSSSHPFDTDSNLQNSQLEGSAVTKLIPLAENSHVTVSNEPPDHLRLTESDFDRIGTDADANASHANSSQHASISRSMSTATASMLKKGQALADEEDGAAPELKEETGTEPRQSIRLKHSLGSSSEPRGKIGKRYTRKIYSSVDKLPAALRGHVIICLDGESALVNLEALLRRIWMRRSGQRKRAPVVVIHPRFPKNYARTLGEDRSGLFLLQGNSLSLETLKQAQYQSARAVLIMASESHDGTSHGSTDSKCIFTVMTLDSLLSDQDTFVCCVLDAEDSLQLLRAPRQARRVGVNLGEQREPDLFNYERSPRAGFPQRTTSSTSFMANLPSSPFLPNYARPAPFGSSGGMLRPYSNAARFLGGQNRQSRLMLSGMTRSNSMRIDQAEPESSDDDEPSNMRTLKEQHSHQQKSREELFERQRYASGELVISSLLTALLARDYTDPGYIRLIRQLIGSSSGSKGSWIRQVDIPESWTRAEKAIRGRTYRETSTRLLELGCIALGLYRSGDSPVRVETRSEQLVIDNGHLSDAQEQAFGHRAESIQRRTGSSAMSGDMHSSTLLGPGGLSTRPHEGTPLQYSKTATGRTSVSDMLFSLGDDGDEFDQLYYTCPTTRRRIYFQEAINGENVLPYVYTCPEPYSLVVASDAVFVLCDPARSIPADWDED